MRLARSAPRRCLGRCAVWVAVLGLGWGGYVMAHCGKSAESASTDTSGASTWPRAAWVPGTVGDRAATRSETEAILATGRPWLGEAGHLGLPGFVKLVRVSGSWVYAVSGDCVPFPSPYDPTCEGTLTVIRVADTGRPLVVGAWSVPNEHETIVDLVARGPIAYVVVERRAVPELLGSPAPRIEVLHVMDPTSIAPIATIQPDTPAHHHRDIEAYGDHLYWVTLPDASTEGVAIIDIEEPSEAKVVGSLSTTGDGVAFSDRVLWLSREVSIFEETDDALRSYDLADPRRPVLLGQTHGRYREIAANGPFVVAKIRHPYPPTGWTSELHEFDVRDPSAPERVWRGFAGPDVAYWSFGWMNGWLLVGRGDVYGLHPGDPEGTLSRVIAVDELAPGATTGGTLTDMSVDGVTVCLSVVVDAGDRSLIVILRTEGPRAVFMPLATNG